MMRAESRHWQGNFRIKFSLLTKSQKYSWVVFPEFRDARDCLNKMFLFLRWPKFEELTERSVSVFSPKDYSFLGIT